MVVVLLLTPRQRPEEGVEVVVVVVLLPPRQNSHNFAICCQRLKDCPRVDPLDLIRTDVWGI